MNLPRMRTLNETIEEIKNIDPQSSISIYFIRSLCKEGKVHCFFTGKKLLVDFDSLLDYLITDAESFSSRRENLA